MLLHGGKGAHVELDDGREAEYEERSVLEHDHEHDAPQLGQVHVGQVLLGNARKYAQNERFAAATALALRLAGLVVVVAAAVLHLLQVDGARAVALVLVRVVVFVLLRFRVAVFADLFVIVFFVVVVVADSFEVGVGVLLEVVDGAAAAHNQVETELEQTPREDAQREAGHARRLLHVLLVEQREQVDNVRRQAHVDEQELRQRRTADVSLRQYPLAQYHREQQYQLEKVGYRRLFDKQFK